MYNQIPNIEIENARIIFRNFSGAESKFNRKGDRNFCVIIDNPETAEQLSQDGWNIKILQPRDPEDKPSHYLKVNVSFDYTPPTVWKVTSKKKMMLDEETVGDIDYVDIKSADVVIRPYKWEVNGKTGISAYLKNLYVVVDEDSFAGKYAEYPSDDNMPF